MTTEHNSVTGNRMMGFDHKGLKPLSTEQYDQCRERAQARVKSRIGGKPLREDFRRDLSPLWTILDVLALPVFTPAFIVNSIHIITHMGKLAADSYTAVVQASAGTVIGRDFYTAAHQWAFIFLAEGAMILFLVMFGMSKDGWRKWVYLLLALAALTFVFVANWHSGMGGLESILAPVFTVGIGLKLEHLIGQSITRREEVDKRYMDALTQFEVAAQDATKHPEYMPFCARKFGSGWSTYQLIKTTARCPRHSKRLPCAERWSVTPGLMTCPLLRPTQPEAQ
jgi:hypothetical protein